MKAKMNTAKVKNNIAKTRNSNVKANNTRAKNECHEICSTKTKNKRLTVSLRHK
jgi:hypothetical protein